jgi:hypothetical protein
MMTSVRSWKIFNRKNKRLQRRDITESDEIVVFTCVLPAIWKNGRENENMLETFRKP